MSIHLWHLQRGDNVLRKSEVSALQTATIRRIGEPFNYELQIAAGAPRADVSISVPVEAEGNDSDGHALHVLLRVVEGFAKFIETYREDGQEVVGTLRVDAFELFAPFQKEPDD